MAKRQYKTKVLREHLLQDKELLTQFEMAIDKLIEKEERISKKAIKDLIDISHHKLDLLYPYFAESRNARIEMQCTIADKKRWQHNAEKNRSSVSKLVAHALNEQKVIIPQVVEINEVVTERIRFNSLVNQIARWANTHKSSADALIVLSALDTLSSEFEKHDRRVMRILYQDPHFNAIRFALPRDRYEQELDR